NRGEDTRASYRRHDLANPRRRLAGLELERHRPAGRARYLAEAALEAQVVHLHDQPVDLVGQGVALGLEAGEQGEDLVERPEPAAPRYGPQAEAGQPLEGVPVGRELRTADLSRAVADEVEGACGRDGRIELLQRTRRRVPRIGEGRETGVLALAVQAPEGGDREEDLAADLEERRQRSVVRPQTEREAPDGPHVRRDVLAREPVAARRGRAQHAVLVDQLDRHAVDLRLAHVLDAL